MKTIGIEEHFAIPEVAEKWRAIMRKTYPNAQVIEEEKYLDLEVPFADNSLQSASAEDAAIVESRLLDIKEGRIKVMDEQGITMQALSHISPSIQSFEPAVATELARLVNDRMAESVKLFPDRFLGLATLGVLEPAAAVAELERAIRTLGLHGVSINSHTKGQYLDDKKFWPILAKAEELDVPIYLHPRCPSALTMEAFATYPELTGSMFGFGAETSLHLMRMMAAGVFNEFPKLKIIMGHLGEALPFWVWRLDNRLLHTPLGAKYNRLPSQIFAENVWVTTSGNYSPVAFECALHVCGADHILFAVDYPMEDNREAVAFLNNLAISPLDKEKIAHGNAEALFKLK